MSTMITVTNVGFVFTGLTWFIKILSKSNHTLIVRTLCHWFHWDLESLNKTKLFFSSKKSLNTECETSEDSKFLMKRNIKI